MRKTAMAALALALAMAMPGAMASARTDTFTETNAKDFEAGHAEGVVVSSLGALRLGRALEDLLKEAEGVDYVARMAQAPDGTAYAVTGGAGRVYRIKDGKVDLFVTLEDPFLFSCAVDAEGVLYVGSGGTKGRIWRVKAPNGGPPKAEVLFEADDLKYVWDLVCLKDGALAAATGDQGKLLRITRDGKSEVLIDSEAAHVLCLALAPDDTLYAGTDGAALVYRYAGKKSFILYDAAEAEVTGLALDADGNLYVGVSSGAGGRRGGAQPAAAKTARTGGTVTIQMGASGSASAKPDGDKGAGNAPAPEKPAEAAEAPEAPPAEPPPAPPAPPAPEPRAGTGNGVYHITPGGLVTRVFEGRDTMTLGLAVSGKCLLVATGRDAHVYEVALDDSREQACVATLDPKQAMAILVERDGRILLGTASPGRLYTLSKGYAKEGTYTSRVFDAGASATWGALEWRGQKPGGTAIRLATRSGNVSDPEKGGWSDWSRDQEGSPARIESPAARFLQVRVTLKSGNDAATPVLEQYEAAYVPVNEPPEVTAIEEIAQGDESARARNRAEEQFRQAAGARNRETAQRTPAPKPPRGLGRQPIRMIQWRASDPNRDELRFDLYLRAQGDEVWVTLDKGLLQPTWPWDTSTVADGWYEIKVVASDRVDNAADRALEGVKISDPILVDNTAPTFERLEAKVNKRQVEVRFTAADATSRLVEAAYAVDSSSDWQTLVPVDGIFDGRKKEFRFTIPDLPPGAHRVAVRASDQAGNTGHAGQSVTIAEEK